jgi:hypothetical protein
MEAAEAAEQLAKEQAQDGQDASRTKLDEFVQEPQPDNGNHIGLTRQHWLEQDQDGYKNERNGNKCLLPHYSIPSVASGSSSL